MPHSKRREVPELDLYKNGCFFFFLQKPKVTQWKKIAFSTNSATAKLETYIWSDVSKDMSYNCHKKSKLRWMILLKLLRFGIGFLKDETSKT